MFSQFFKLKPEPKTEALQIGSRSVPLLFVHHSRARRYLLRLRQDGVARVTIPRRGSISAARDFVTRNIGWLKPENRFREKGRFAGRVMGIGIDA
jgi:predicted metal-dependent hydrolase